MSSKNYDFSGWATRNDIKCADGLTIRQDAFKDCDGITVPLVYMHNHKDLDNVLGHALLENRKDGVYCYASFNDSDQANIAKTLVAHGDITSLSIFANQLVKKGKDVLHGAIREVSLVLAGANPGATIDFPYLEHSDGSYEEVEDEAIVSYMQPLSVNEELKHMFDEDYEEDILEHADEEEETSDDEETVQDVMDTLNDKQKDLLEGMMAIAYEQGVQDAGGAKDAEKDKDEAAQSGLDEGETIMHKNVFEGETMETLQHGMDSETASAILADAKNSGSLKNASLSHGITDIDWLFPEAKTASATPGWIKRDTGWVSGVLNGVHHTPYSRIKSMFADIREDEARAKGYIKDEYKKEEVFSLLKRQTVPQTIYKKQKLDRDDIIDITDFDVVAWIKAEMRMMLDEEIARAILVGDGRLASSDEKINEQNVRPIWKDDDLYSVKVKVTYAGGADDNAKAQANIKALIKNRKLYKGSGNPKFYTTEDVLADMLLITDTTGRFIYDSTQALANKIRVSEIVTVPVFDNLTRTVVTQSGSETRQLLGIMVNLQDYNVGADKGGAVNMFDDFDIDYNKETYLIETRISGALTVPFSALVLETVVAG